MIIVVVLRVLAPYICNILMNHPMTKICLLSFFCCSIVLLNAQNFVFPGDANANGIVDQYDLLSIGYVYGGMGPARLQDGATEPQGIPLFWEDEFPNGTNFIHADTDGNGLVNLLDFIALHNNFNTVLENNTPLNFPTASLDQAPTISWNNGQDVYATGGNNLNIPIHLPLNDEQAVNGLAFDLRYDPTHFQTTPAFSNASNWLAQDGQSMFIAKHTNPGTIKIATSRLANDYINGGGDVGTLDLVIIIDMVDLLEAPDDTLKSKVYLENIMMVDENFNTVAVASDSLMIKCHLDNHISATKEQRPNALMASVFPNPSREDLNIRSHLPFTSIKLVDALGRSVLLYQGAQQYSWHTDAINFAPALYSLIISGTDGRSVLKYLQL